MGSILLYPQMFKAERNGKGYTLCTTRGTTALHGRFTVGLAPQPFRMRCRYGRYLIDSRRVTYELLCNTCVSKNLLYIDLACLAGP